MTDRLLNTKEAARFIGVKPQTIERWRMNDIRIPYIRIGRAIRYRTEDLAAWLERKTVRVNGVTEAVANRRVEQRGD